MKLSISGRPVATLPWPRLGAVIACLGFAATLCWSTPAAAQLSRVGNSVGMIETWVFGSNACYDPNHQVYLIVGGQGPIKGIFVTAGNQPASGVFGIGSANATKPFGVFPRCAYSPGVNNGQGGFLVAWHQDDSVNFLHSLLVAYPGGVIAGSEQVLSDGTDGGSNFRFGAAIAYSPTSQRFLVAFGTLNSWNLQGRFVGNNGVPLGGIMGVANAPSGGGVQEPALTWNSSTDEFGLAYSGFDSSGGFVSFKRIAASSGAQASSPRFGAAVGTFATGVGYNPNTGNYVMGWSSQGSGALAAEIDAQGNVLSTGLISSRLGTPTSFDLAFNPVSGTFLAISEDTQSSDVVGVEVNRSGVPNTTAATLTNGCANGSFFPRVGARTDAKEWNITFARCFTSVTDQIISTTSAEAGPAPAVSNVQMAIEQPANGATLASGSPFTVSGWAVDRGVTDGSSGIDTVHVYAQPSGGSAQLVGYTTSFVNRSGDLGSLLGAQASSAGFSVSVGGLAAGDYTIIVFARSTMTGEFSATTVSVSVTSGTTSQPLMAIDTPTNGSTVPGFFNISGWALDRSASSGSGVDAVHVWAFPSDGSPIFLGAAAIGLSRPDLGGVFGSQFTSAGFNLSATLPTGSYRITVFMHTVATGSFNWAQNVDITVSAPVSTPLIVVDAPTPGNMVRGSTISGWALDLGSVNNSGIDAVHIYAYPVSGDPIFLGQATNGMSRKDVGAIFGNQFTNSGFALTPDVGLLLPLTEYDIVVFARSTITGVWSSRVVHVTTQ